MSCKHCSPRNKTPKNLEIWILGFPIQHKIRKRISRRILLIKILTRHGFPISESAKKSIVRFCVHFVADGDYHLSFCALKSFFGALLRILFGRTHSLGEKVDRHVWPPVPAPLNNSSQRESTPKNTFKRNSTLSFLIFLRSMVTILIFPKLPLL